MYCVNCGVKLEHTEKVCPLCGTIAYHPTVRQAPAEPLYPAGRIPEIREETKKLRWLTVILLLIPMTISIFADWQGDGTLSWFGFVGGALILTYLIFFLPLWFKKPKPIAAAAINFTAIAAYLFYINLATGGCWFFSFALPVTAVMCLIVITVTAVLHRKRKGRLYIWGGTMMALGAFMPFIEVLLAATFDIPFIGWSIYPLVVLVLLGGALIYLAINRTAREMMERKLFF
ncbi:MAG: zinc ribbon domain-containing protein [Oscillospiraceae bacterium]|nr:zinc ribbon domain-containing protein [Oscillospiraceae bacterium]